jgi:hypothetical protein
MRAVSMLLGLVLLFFAVLQYNDPDALYWGGVYLLAAGFQLAVLLRGRPLARAPVLRLAAWLCIGLFLLGFASLAGTIGPGWIHVEEAREAFGYLICAGATGFALLATRARRSLRPGLTRS